jgi:hypothetical protein
MQATSESAFSPGRATGPASPGLFFPAGQGYKADDAEW